jgi:hypothetical protein
MGPREILVMNWPSTTAILRHFGLMATYEQFGNPAALQRGRLVTAACHLIAAGKPLDYWEDRHPECQPYLTAYRAFIVDHQFKLLECEREYKSHVHRFISHPDQIGRLDGFGLVDLELKSGSMPPCCPLQTAGQVLAIGVPTMKRFALLLNADGTYKLYPHEDFRDFDRFRALVTTWWTIQSYSQEAPSA